MIFHQVSGEHVDVDLGLDGEHQRSKAEIFWMLNFNV